ncbi:hypothetical protein [Pseudomarimonas arenosa]|uniref:LVIVD repeat-containing protein n=1 Tax=Pseudomarimonas arenosa TaxID=2774145 RepID=A0AAW3ZJ39_9GAMM|nr:hypothetical protein [Pseudomarimonas arenosa]MBD8524331.1 hypothetical protein [Pseudomarimonas arenosa]
MHSTPHRQPKAAPRSNPLNRLLGACLLVLFASTAHSAEEKGVDREYTTHPPAPSFQTAAEADAKSDGCISCHSKSDEKTMHRNPAVVLGCTDCHGGNAQVTNPAPGKHFERHAIGSINPLKKVEYDAHHKYPHVSVPYSSEYLGAMEQAHVLPRFPDRWYYPASRNPEDGYAHLNDESPEFIRFINPGDLRIADEACGACHLPIVQATKTSLMATSAMLWGGASYNNGILPYKRYNLGEYYTKDSGWGAISNPVEVTDEMKKRGILPVLYPLPAWEVIPPADVFRVFERGGRNINTTFPETGLPNSLGLIQRLEEPGRPDLKQSNRGPGTGQRVAIPVLNIHKSRLNDPHLWFLGTNENPGDFRSSGCTACHVVYANDRDPRHSSIYAKFGNEGFSQQLDPTIPKDEPGHPLKHEFTRQIPSSQCMICHMHQPNMFINTMLGYIMWDYEPDAPTMFPKEERKPTDSQIRAINKRNPEEAAIRGNWAEPEFLQSVAERNPSLTATQFADYHGHGWNFRAVFKRDRKGNLLDAEGNKVANDDPKKFEKAVHMSSVHVDLGMQCVDCHFQQDAHSNGHIVGEVMAGVEIMCQDCHGTADAYPELRTSGPMAPTSGTNLSLIRNPDGKRRFEWIDGKLIQRSAVVPGLEWTMTLLKDVSSKASDEYNVLADRSHTMSRDTEKFTYGTDVPKEERAHGEETMLCYTCHTSWTTSCGGCHLPIQANWKTERQHYEGKETRNYATYNPQVARDDMFQLGIHGEIKNYKIAPVRSSSALVLSSTNTNRERIYIQQPPIAASGFSSQAFAPHYPHTERRTETKRCTDCHVSDNNDNNAIMAQLLLQGTKFVDFVGFNAWVGGDGEISGVVVTEWDEPQAVIGSYLHKYAYPERYGKHQERGNKLPEGYSHSAGTANCIQHRGEYLFVSEGSKGTRAYDIASIANKGFSQRVITAPFSELGHDTHIESKNATCVALPTTQPVAPERNKGELMRDINLEQPFHPIYHYAFIADAEEGLIVVNVDTLADLEPRNNLLERALTWNEGGVLTGVRHLTIAGRWFFASTPRGVVVLDMNDPMKPQHVTTVAVDDPRAVQVQFRYAFVTSARGLQVIDITQPTQPVLLDAVVPLQQAHKLHVARTYAYVANGNEGVAIIDVSKADQPTLYRMFNAGGQIVDARDVVVASTNASPFLYVADGTGGLKVVQLTSPDLQPNFYGYAAEPEPQLVATWQTKHAALSLSRGLERDRAVDESGGQIAVLGRVGSRPFNAEEMKRLYMNDDGSVWKVSDEVEGPRGKTSKPMPFKPNRIWDLQPENHDAFDLEAPE